jgi:hypothetical protein
VFSVLVFLIGVQYFYYSYRLGDEKTKLKQLEAIYNSRADEVVRYIRLKEILFQSQKIISSRKQYQELLAGVYETFPAGVGVVSAEFEGVKDLRFSGRAFGIGEYEAFLRKFELESKSGDFLYKKVNQDSLSRQDDGSYQFQLSLSAK